MSKSGRREWRFYLDDMIEFAENMLDYTRGLERADFAADKIIRDDVPELLPLLKALRAES